MNDGDWIDGAVKWWWKYVMPAEDAFWTNIVAQRAGPSADPWRGAVSQALEAVALLQAASRSADSEIGARLQTEAATKLHGASQRLSGQQAAGA